MGSPKIQRGLQALHDRKVREGLISREQQEGRWEDATRLQELGNPSVSLEWMWALNRFHGPTLAPARYADGVRILLGIASAAQPAECRLCGKSIEHGGAHGLHCPWREITVRHNNLRDA